MKIIAIQLTKSAFIAIIILIIMIGIFSAIDFISENFSNEAGAVFGMFSLIMAVVFHHLRTNSIDSQ